jgi:hypothetical protein
MRRLENLEEALHEERLRRQGAEAEMRRLQVRGRRDGGRMLSVMKRWGRGGGAEGYGAGGEGANERRESVKGVNEGANGRENEGFS